VQGERRPPLPTTHKLPILTFSAKEAGVALVASLLRARHGRIEPVERASVQPKGRSYSRTLFARGEHLTHKGSAYRASFSLRATTRARCA